MSDIGSQLDDINLPRLKILGEQFLAYLNHNVFTYIHLVEVGLVLLGFGFASLVAPRIARIFEHIASNQTLPPLVRDGLSLARPLSLPAVWLCFQWVTMVAVRQSGLSANILMIAVNLLSAWLVLRLASRLIRHTIWSNLLFTTVMIVVVLNIVGLLDPLIAALDATAVEVGSTRVSVYILIKGMISLAVLLWAASLASRFLADRIQSIQELTPNVQALLSKLLQLVLATIAVLLALNIIGVNLTMFAVFSGAIGIGIGLGLQQTASNVISGFILLLDKRIKPGDVIAIGDTFGWVTSMGGNYVSVRTRDGIEHLVPNEFFMTKGVENWSYSDRAVRLKLPFGVSYRSDPHKVIAVSIEAASEVTRILPKPAPICIVKGFGDSTVDMELRVWLLDPQNGVGNVKGEVYLKLWDALRANGIELPYPQRDIHIKSVTTDAEHHAEIETRQAVPY